MYRHSHLLFIRADSEVLLVIRHLANEHEPNVYRGSYGFALAECSHLPVFPVQRCPIQGHSQILPQVVEHGHFGSRVSNFVPSWQKGIFFLYPPNVRFIHDFLGGFRNGATISAPAHIERHGGA